MCVAGQKEVKLKHSKFYLGIRKIFNSEEDEALGWGLGKLGVLFIGVFQAFLKKPLSNLVKIWSQSPKQLGHEDVLGPST